MKLKDIPIHRGRKNEKDNSVNDGERNQLRVTVQCLMWLARQAPPDIMGSTAWVGRQKK